MDPAVITLTKELMNPAEQTCRFWQACGFG
jgi:hypothetical protein